MNGGMCADGSRRAEVKSRKRGTDATDDTEERKIEKGKQTYA